MNPSSSLLCPQCGLAEPVQKVSVLYEGNTKEWQETSGSGDDRHTVTRQAKTLLGQRLSPPPKPSAGLNPKVLWWGGCGLLAFIALTAGLPLCFGLVAALVSILVPLGLLTSETGVVSPGLLEQWNVPDWAGWGALACVGVGVLVVLLVGAWLSVRAYGWLRTQYTASVHNYQKRVVDNAYEVSRWERALEKWNNLYYCSRDDVVFLPGQRAVPSAEMLNYIREL